MTEATVHTVSGLAGVSTRTVYRVLTGSAPVSDGTRRRIEQAMVAVGYRANDARRMPDASGQIAIVVLQGAPPTLVDAIHRGVIDSIGQEARTASRVDVVPGPDVAGAVSRTILRLAEAGIGGVILIATHDAVTEAVDGLQGIIPIVVALSDDPECSTVGIDSCNGAVQATRHLIALGHTRIAHVGGPTHLHHARERARGFRETLEESGLDPTVVVEGDWSARSGLEAAIALRAAGATAVFCASDQMALGVLHAYSAAGQPAPHGISVIGYDDEPDAAFYSPGLTTIRQDYAAVGRSSYAALADLLAGGRPRHIDLIPELVVRSSTARVPR